jgi:hypothetical protein
MKDALPRVGSGCTSAVRGFPRHNPGPSTIRGRRRVFKDGKAAGFMTCQRWHTPKSMRPIHT